MKPIVSISCGVGDENRYTLPTMPLNIQLSTYQCELYHKYKNDITKEIKDNGINVNVVHLPIDILRIELKEAYDIIKESRELFNCRTFVIHPNKRIKIFLEYFFANSQDDSILCVENFDWRKNKELRSPLEIIDFINELRNEYTLSTSNIKFCFDTSHAEAIWVDYRILPFILNHANVIHLSNKKGRQQHLPFNIQDGDLNLVKFVSELVFKYKWYGNIVLEYMPEYQDKLYKNVKFVEKLIDGAYNSLSNKNKNIRK